MPYYHPPASLQMLSLKLSDIPINENKHYAFVKQVLSSKLNQPIKRFNKELPVDPKFQGKTEIQAKLPKQPELQVFRSCKDGYYAILGRDGFSGMASTPTDKSIFTSDLSKLGLKRRKSHIIPSHHEFHNPSLILGHKFPNFQPAAEIIATVIGKDCLPQTNNWLGSAHIFCSRYFLIPQAL